MPIPRTGAVVSAAAYIGTTLLLWFRTRNQAALALLRRTKKRS